MLVTLVSREAREDRAEARQPATRKMEKMIKK